MLAVAAGATAVGATMAPTTAKAADGQFMVVGAPNACESTTAITLGAGIGGLPAALTLTNVNGPSLRLAPVGDEWVGDLRVGDIVTTDRGPLIGVNPAEAWRPPRWSPPSTWTGCRS